MVEDGVIGVDVGRDTAATQMEAAVITMVTSVAPHVLTEGDVSAPDGLTQTTRDWYSTARERALDCERCCSRAVLHQRTNLKK